MAEPLLSVAGLTVRYGAIEAVTELTLDVHEGEHVTLIGANGAGKTSTLKAITGLIPASAQAIRFAGRPLTDLAGHQRMALGLVMVPEGRGVFARMSVAENLRLGGYRRRDQAAMRQETEAFPHLQHRLEQPAGLLSGGEQQMLALARGLLARPRLLILDEPSMGLAPVLVEQIFAVIRRVCAQGMTLLLVEQNARLALDVTERAYVLDSGRLVLQGESRDLAQDPQVRSAYLGD